MNTRWTRRPEITLMADYGCFTWTRSPELFAFRSSDGLDLARLGVSPDLAQKLADWHKEWEDENYGVAVSAEASETWEQRGWSLARELGNELPDIDVNVWDDENSVAVPVADLPPQ